MWYFGVLLPTSVCVCVVGPARLLSSLFPFFLYYFVFLDRLLLDTDDCWAMSPLSRTICSVFVKVLLDEMHLERMA